MATMPDLPTSDVGLVSYYNLEDNGSLDYDLTNILDLQGVDSYAQYDNGIRGTYNISFSNIPTRTVNFRAKTDGWIIVWIDQSEQFYGADGDRSLIRKNLVDFFGDWTGSGINNLPDTNYAQVMKDLVNAADSDLSFSASDVSVYCYSYEPATNINILGIPQGDNWSSYTFSYTSGVNRFYEAVAAGNGLNPDSGKGVIIEGTYVTDGENSVGTLDNIAEGLTPSSGTNYTVSNDTRDARFAYGSIVGIFEV